MGVFESLLAIGAAFFMVIGFIALLLLIAQWKIFEKAGQPGWACIVPIYNVIVLLEIVGKPIWWLFLLIIPGVNLIVGLMLTHLLSKSFGQGIGFTLGLIFLPFIFHLILAFGSAKYIGPAGE